MAAPVPSRESDPNQRFLELLARIESGLGISQVYVRNHLMPVWWEEGAENNRQAFLEGALTLAKNIGIDPECALAPGAPVKPDVPQFACKTPANTDQAKFQPTCHVAIALAEIGLRLSSKTHPKGPLSSAALRKTILERSPTVSLEAVLDISWELGIPVLHLNEAPGPKPHGFVVRLGTRYVIVLARNKKHSGWIVFDLLHELGHIEEGHLSKNDVWIDSTIEPESHDLNEQEANSYALRVLCEQSNVPAYLNFRSASNLIRSANAFGDAFKIDPQWLIVASGWNHGRWAAVNKALVDGWPNDDAVALINRKMIEHGQLNELSEREANLLQTLTGVVLP